MDSPISNSNSLVLRQEARYKHAIGKGTPASLVQDIVTFAEDAQRPEFYKIYETTEDGEVWYEMLEKEGLETRLGKIADTWAEDWDNIERASKHVGRQATKSKPPDVKGFGFCQFKPRCLLGRGPGVDRTQQTVVFIALQDLGPSNGFPLHLQLGEDVCMDGGAYIWTPPSGGGRAIFISLNL